MQPPRQVLQALLGMAYQILYTQCDLLRIGTKIIIICGSNEVIFQKIKRESEIHGKIRVSYDIYSRIACLSYVRTYKQIHGRQIAHIVYNVEEFLSRIIMCFHRVKYQEIWMDHMIARTKSFFFPSFSPRWSTVVSLIVFTWKHVIPM